MNRVLFRVDQSPQVGWGHWMRCTALAQALRSYGVEDLWLTGKLPDNMMSQRFLKALPPRTDHGSLEDAFHTLRTAHGFGADWVVVDGYGFSAKYRNTLREGGLRVLWVDDLGCPTDDPADAIWNPNLHAVPALYPGRSSGNHLLLGSRFVCLREGFWPYRHSPRQRSGDTSRLLVLLGGQAPVALWRRVLDALDELLHAGVEVVCLAGEQRDEELGRLAQACGVEWRAGVLNVERQMAQADWAVSAAGTTSWELAFMGVPAVLVARSDNQLPVAEALYEAGGAISLGSESGWDSARLRQELRELWQSPGRLQRMSQSARRLIDGRGGDRIHAQLGRLGVQMRRARAEDCRQVFEWANDPATRESSFSTRSIAWREHQRWFRERLHDPRCVFFVAMDGNALSLGPVRFEIRGDEAEIHMSLAPGVRGQGLAWRVIDLGVRELFWASPVRRVTASVKPDNVRSLRAFERAGFRYAGTTSRGTNTAHLERERDVQ